MFVVGKAGRDDTAAIVNLLSDMDSFYDDPVAFDVQERFDQVQLFLFGGDGVLAVLLARAGVEVAGLASCSLLWPAVGASRSLFLKELYVASRWRGHGAGRALMTAVEQLAAEWECTRLEFTTDMSNMAAHRFYAQLGYQPLETKVFYRRSLS